MRIYLVGYMGSGKSKAGKALAAAMRCKFLDTDAMIEESAGMNVPLLFSEKGEDYFRRLEKKILRLTEQHPNVVVATGGGLPCFHDNMNWMNEHGITVYLEANEGLLFHRLATSKQERPLLQNLDAVSLMEKISRHLTERTPVYNLAKIKINAASLNVKALQQKLAKKKMG
ncbi:MAG: AAA family ATPase [Bacteroidetes bacterium]|nr:AAA family ATPase [Bacteroidota bacterium]